MSRTVLGVAGAGPAFDPARVDGMRLWLDERALCSDGAAGTTIELNASAAKAYAEMVSSAVLSPEQGRYFGQYVRALRPLKGAFNGWPCPQFHHDNSGGGIGTHLPQINTNAVTTTKTGTAAAFFPPWDGSAPVSDYAYTGMAFARLPAAPIDGDTYVLASIQGATWNVRMLRDTTHRYCYVFHQGRSVTAGPFVDLSAGAFAADGDFLAFAPYFDGTQVVMDVMRADGTIVSTFAGACDPMGSAQVDGYKFVIGGASGTSSWDGEVCAFGICWRLMDATERHGMMSWGLAKYGAVNAVAFPEGPTPIDPVTLHPADLWAPGAFVGIGVCDEVPNAGGNGAGSFKATLTARPVIDAIGALPALVFDGIDDVMVLDGIESDINSDVDAITIIGVIDAVEQTPTYPSTPTVIAGDSGLADPLLYIGGGVRGPMVIWPAASIGGGGVVQTTIVGWTPPGPDRLVYVGQSLPTEAFDGFYVARAICNGEMQSSYGASQTGDRTGAMRLGEHVGNFLAAKATPPYVWARALSYRETQGVRRFLSLAAALAT